MRSSSKFHELRMNWRRRLGYAGLLVLALLGIGQVGGCYYLQAVSGQMELMGRREPIERVIASESTPEALAARLTLVTEAREFAVADLLLPDNDSYRSFADLEREYVVWNVFAAPEFSLDARTWCFPVVGCVAYRGYFSEDAARSYAERLHADGYDVHVGGVSAYSTLGRFADPVLNTMLRWSDLDLVAVMFHELAHQRLFVKGDTAFNESFATAVAEIGLARWVEQHGGADDLDGYQARSLLREELMTLVGSGRQELAAIYASEAGEDEKRRQKARVLESLAEEAAAIAARRGMPAANFLQGNLNNARLVSLGLYHGHVDAFREIYSACESRLECFYATAESIAALPGDRRAAELADVGSR